MTKRIPVLNNYHLIIEGVEPYKVSLLSLITRQTKVLREKASKETIIELLSDIKRQKEEMQERMQG